MIYEYHCPNCGKKMDVIKSVKDFDREERCPCGSAMKRAVAPSRLYFANTSVQEMEWQPALGKPATRRQLEAEAKERGWVEVGNEKPEKHLRPEPVEYPSFSNDEIASLARRGEI